MRTKNRRLIVILLGIVAMLGASPAAAIFQPNWYTIDFDSVVVAREQGTDYRLFSGTMEFFHDGDNIAARLYGRIYRRDYSGIKITFRYQDGATEVIGVNGVSGNSLRIEEKSSRNVNVLKATVSASGAYSCTEPFCPDYTNTTVNVLAGDSPVSKGTCDQLDTDTVHMDSRDADLDAAVKWSCSASTGHILMNANVSLFRNSGATQNAYVTGAVSYADGSQSLFVSSNVSASRTSISFTKASNPDKQARSISFRINNNDGVVAGPTSVKIGDA